MPSPFSSPVTGRVPPRQRLWRRGMLLGLIVLIVGTGIYFYRQYHLISKTTTEAGQSDTATGNADNAPKKSRSSAGGNADSRRGGQRQPVRVASSTLGDLPVYIDSLGSIIPNNTVVVKPQIAGRIDRIFFDEGQTVKAGQLLAQIDPRPFTVQLSQVKGQLQRDQALLKNARLDLTRYQDLLAQDSIARQQVDTQAALVRQYEGTVQSDQAQVDNAQLQLSYTRITAPITGRIGLRRVDAGNLTQTSDVDGLAVITQVQPIAALFSIPQDRLIEVNQQMRATQLSVYAVGKDQKTPLAEGKLLTTDNQIDATTGTVKLKARFANADEMLFPNQFANIRLLLRTERDAVLVPSAALQQSTQGIQLFVVNSDHKVSRRTVKTGLSDGQLTQIIEGLKIGEQVVIDGIDKLRDGMTIVVAKNDRRNEPDEVTDETHANSAPGAKSQASSQSRGRRHAPAAEPQ